MNIPALAPSNASSKFARVWWYMQLYPLNYCCFLTWAHGSRALCSVAIPHSLHKQNTQHSLSQTKHTTQSIHKQDTERARQLQNILKARPCQPAMSTVSPSSIRQGGERGMSYRRERERRVLHCRQHVHKRNVQNGSSEKIGPHGHRCPHGQACALPSNYPSPTRFAHSCGVPLGAHHHVKTFSLKKDLDRCQKISYIHHTLRR